MESKPEFNWMEQCSFCSKTDKSNLQLFSLRYLCRYLKIDFKQLFFQSTKKAGHSKHDMVEVKTDLDKAEVNLCSECGKIIERLSELFKLLEKTEMEVDWWLQGIRELITESDKSHKYFLREGDVVTEMNSIWAEMIKQVRKSIVNKPTKSSSSKPTLILEKCSFKIEVSFENQNIYADMEDPISIKAEIIYTDSEPESNDVSNVKVEEDSEFTELGSPPDLTSIALQDEDADDSSDNYTPDEEEEEESDDSYEDFSEASCEENSNGQFCEEEFRSKIVIKRHKRQIHSEELEKQANFEDVSNGVLLESDETKRKDQCKICQDTFADSGSLASHFRLVHLTKSTQCHLCAQNFKQRQHLYRHLRDLHNVEPIYTTQDQLKCDKGECDYVTNDKYKLRRHQPTCQGIPKGSDPREVSKCHVCLKKFKQRGHLYRHLRNLHNIEPIKTTNVPEQFKCDQGECSYVTKDKQQLRHHQKTCQGIRVNRVVKCNCEICGNGFKSEFHLKRHKLRVHSGKIFKCDECGKDFKLRRYLQQHVERIHLKIKHKCYHIGCEKSYMDKKLLSLHMKRCERPSPQPHLVEKEPLEKVVEEPEPPQPHYTMDQAMNYCKELGRKQYQCKVCNAIIKERFIFRDHFKKCHVKAKVFECDVCFKKFVTISQLKAHKNNVHADGEYKCDKGECQYTARTELYLKLHQRLCDGVKKDIQPRNSGDHLCSTCGKRFASNKALNYHKNAIHSGRKFVCDQCGKVLKRSQTLQRHVQSEHLGIRYSCENSGCGKKFSTATLLKCHKNLCLKKPDKLPE